jgi:NifU-like protein involved in Fe-S cluster formation
MNAQLYHAALVAKARSGIGKGRLPAANASARLDNPLCGDRVTLDLQLADGRIVAVGHEVKGCLLCEAAAATIAELAPGNTVAGIQALTDGITAMMKEGTPPPPDFAALGIFTPVHHAKSRRDCVLLPFGALTKALSGL